VKARRFAIAIVLCGCGGGATAQQSDGGDAAADTAAEVAPLHGYSLAGFPGGFTFYTRLPPSFSPLLPLSGEEETREPPEADFYDPSSAYFFSYLFIWWLTGTPDLSTAALREDLHIYYAGLCPSQSATVTLGDPEPAAADAGMLVARRSGTLEATTCLSNPVPIAAVQTSTYECPDHAAVIVLVSPQPAASQVWTDLVAIRDGFTCW
jgi:hypothetical protein